MAEKIKKLRKSKILLYLCFEIDIKLLEYVKNAKKNILIAPLNWGLGHATRCIPLIKKAQQAGFRVVLASDGAAGILLKNEFPDLTYLELPSYNIRYPFENILLNVCFLLPKITIGIVREFFLLKKIIKDYNINAIISDNRYGVFSRKKSVKNIFLGHQLNIKLNPKIESLSFSEKIGAKMQYLYLSNFFDAIAIPDAADEDENLAGVLCHGGFWQKKMHTIYIGVQSRFSFFFEDENGKNENEYLKNEKLLLKNENPLSKTKVLILLSGPEPQRSIFEKMILTQLKNLENFDFILVRGVPQKEVFVEKITEKIEIYSHLYTDDLFEIIKENQIIICRSGYSTLMDLCFFDNKKLILIPTPGQTEQVYLAHRLAEKKQCVLQIQNDLNLQNALGNIENIDFFNIKNTENSLDDLVVLLGK